MPEFGPLPAPRWQVLVDRDRPRWKRLSAQMFARVDVYAPDRTLYHVKLVRNGPIVGGRELLSGGTDPMSVAGFLKQNLAAAGQTGWSITVDTPSQPFKPPRTLFRQPVGAQAILVDVAIAIVDAIGRGDPLWDE